jgi:hypothetical protein
MTTASAPVCQAGVAASVASALVITKVSLRVATVGGIVVASMHEAL